MPTAFGDHMMTSTTAAPSLVTTATIQTLPVSASTTESSEPRAVNALSMALRRPASAPASTDPPPAPTTAAPTPRPAPATTAAPARPAPTTTAPPPRPAPTTTAPPPRNSTTGAASWYGAAAGTCASPSQSFGTVLTVTDLATGASTQCTVDDREASNPGRVVDLSEATFAQLADPSVGVIEVRLSW